MNALWITRMSAYKNSPLSIESAKILIRLKIERQCFLLKKYKEQPISYTLEKATTIVQVSLEEARAAKSYWHGFGMLIPAAYTFEGRLPHRLDIPNRLLDIGYHHLTIITKKLLEQHDVSSALGLLHVARNSDSAPLAYDLVEMFRADIVDAEVLRFLRLKKKPLIELQQDDIAHFLHEVNERLNRLYYLRDFRQCQTYRYYMELQLLKFISAVNNKKIMEPLRLPNRHDGRCKNLTPRPSVVFSLQDVP